MCLTSIRCHWGRVSVVLEDLEYGRTRKRKFGWLILRDTLYTYLLRDPKLFSGLRIPRGVKEKETRGGLVRERQHLLPEIRTALEGFWTFIILEIKIEHRED